MKESKVKRRHCKLLLEINLIFFALRINLTTNKAVIFVRLKEQTTMKQKIILFDGVCNFCDATINFVIERDPKGVFQYASLQSTEGEKLLTKFGLDTQNYDSFVLVEGDHFYTKSSAALQVAKELVGLWPILYIFIVIPKFIRDGVYSLIARNRYKWFGKKEECMIPSPEVRKRFIG